MKKGKLMKFTSMDSNLRKDKIGVNANIKLDNPSDGDKRMRVYSKYEELMKNGKWIDVHSSDPNSKKREWGSPSDYLGKGLKLLLYNKNEPVMTVITGMTSKEAFYHNKNYHIIRNVMLGNPAVFTNPIPPELIVSGSLESLELRCHASFEEIDEMKFDGLEQKYRNWKSSESWGGSYHAVTRPAIE
ncbi:MAG: hypothetical protein QXU18_10280 [Thermoplasmatales archaeon]